MSDTLNRELSETVQDRLQALQELTEFTEHCETKLKELFDSLGWDQEWSENIDTVLYKPSFAFSLIFFVIVPSHTSKCSNSCSVVFSFCVKVGYANLNLASL